MPPPSDDASIPAAGHFATTHWSVVLQAQQRASPAARDALAALCRVYWYPLYAYVRRRVASADRAEELTQEFFARLLEKNYLDPVEPARGRFRAFLLACCKHFLANERDREHAQKRGGGRTLLPLDFHGAADRYRREPAHEETPERLFERRWALALLDETLERLRQEYERDGKGALYGRLKGALVGDGAASYREIGAALGASEAAVKKAAQRLRQRYRELLREQIAATVDGPEQIDDEIRALFAALGA